jgi:hypothetical protein
MAYEFTVGKNEIAMCGLLATMPLVARKIIVAPLFLNPVSDHAGGEKIQVAL